VIKGLELCRLFYAEAVRPLLGDLPHAAARVGPGSDVLGFDSARSTDHDWGPRLELFLTPEDVRRHGAALSAMLAQRLPKRFRGWSTHFAAPPDDRVRVMAETDGPVAHYITITDVGSWCVERLGFDPLAGVTLLDWLATPWQRFAEVTGGAVFHDDLGALTAVRERLAWYPDDLWRYVLASQWRRIAQEEAFVGRAAEAGDDFGSRLVAARLAREAGRLVLLLGRRWPPYQKWLGVAVASQPAASHLADAVRADGIDGRAAGLCAAYEAAGAWQNHLGLAAAVPATRRRYFDRPYLVIGADRFADALRAAIGAAEVAALSPVGVVDQAFDGEDALSRPDVRRAAMIAAHSLGTD
jgi:Domain of unknown function (DUF4037)